LRFQASDQVAEKGGFIVNGCDERYGSHGIDPEVKC
jgi:hypothetical protein